MVASAVLIINYNNSLTYCSEDATHRTQNDKIEHKCQIYILHFSGL